MPRDKRLYMTFPIDFWMHPKVEQLSDAAFRTFVEMNGFSRMQELDGAIPGGSARKRWKEKSLNELLRSHPERPLVLKEESVYVIRDYAEHQFTTNDHAELIAKNTANGRLGGRPKKNPDETQSVTETKPNRKQGQSQGQGQGQVTDMSADNESSQVPNTSTPERDSVIQSALRIGLTNLTKTKGHLEKATGETISDRGALALAVAIASRAAGEIRNIDAYVATACRNSPHEVQAAYFDLDIGGIP